MGGVVSLKLPFALVHRNIETELIAPSSPILELSQTVENYRANKTTTHMAVVEKIGYDGKLKSELAQVDQMENVDLIEHDDIIEST